MKLKAGVDYEETLIEDLKKDPEEAAAYLNAAIEDGDLPVFLLALRHVIQAYGGATKISKKVKMHRVSLYKMLSKNGNPSLLNIALIMKAAGLRIKVEVENNKSRLKAA